MEEIDKTIINKFPAKIIHNGNTYELCINKGNNYDYHNPAIMRDNVFYFAYEKYNNEYLGEWFISDDFFSGAQMLYNFLKEKGYIY